MVNKSNKNDVIKILESHQVKVILTKIYGFILNKRKQNKSIIKLGKQYIEENNVLTIKFNSQRYSNKKKFLNKDDLKQIKFAKGETVPAYTQTILLCMIFYQVLEIKLTRHSKKKTKK